MFILVVLAIAVVIMVIAIAVGISKGTQETNQNQSARQTIESSLQQQGFFIEKRVGTQNSQGTLFIDNTHKKWAVQEWNGTTNVKIHDYSELIDFELNEDEQSIIKGGFGKALVGGILGGTTGAIIGSASSKQIKKDCNLLEIRIRTNDFQKPQYTITLIRGFNCPKSSSLYKQRYEIAQEFVSNLNFIAVNGKIESIAHPQAQATPQIPTTIGDRLRELNALKNEGILTEEEFNTEKHKLLQSNN